MMVSLLTHICITLPQWVNAKRAASLYLNQRLQTVSTTCGISAQGIDRNSKYVLMFPNWNSDQWGLKLLLYVECYKLELCARYSIIQWTLPTSPGSLTVPLHGIFYVYMFGYPRLSIWISVFVSQADAWDLIRRQAIASKSLGGCHLIIASIYTKS